MLQLLCMQKKVQINLSTGMMSHVEASCAVWSGRNTENLIVKSSEGELPQTAASLYQDYYRSWCMRVISSAAFCTDGHVSWGCLQKWPLWVMMLTFKTTGIWPHCLILKLPSNDSNSHLLYFSQAEPWRFSTILRFIVMCLLGLRLSVWRIVPCISGRLFTDAPKASWKSCCPELTVLKSVIGVDVPMNHDARSPSWCVCFCIWIQNVWPIAWSVSRR